MAKSYIAIVLATTLTAATYAGHGAAHKAFSKIDWTAKASAGIFYNKKDGKKAERSHEVVGYLGMHMPGVNAHISIYQDPSDLNTSIKDTLFVDDMHLFGQEGRIAWKAGRTNVRDGFGDTTNDAANDYLLAGETQNQPFDPSTFKKDDVALSTKMNQLTFLVHGGHAHTIDNGAGSDRYDVSGIKLSTTLKGVAMGFRAGHYDNKSEPEKIRTYGLNLKSQFNSVALRFAYSHMRTKESIVAAKNKKQNWVGLEASTKINRFDVTTQIEQADTKEAHKPKAMGIGVQMPLSQHFQLGLGYKQNKDAQNKKIKITAVRIRTAL